MDFVRGTRTWLVIAIGLILVSLISLGVRQLNFSVDFTGGTSFDLTLPAAVATEEVRDALGDIGKDSTIKLAGGGSDVLITTPPLDEAGQGIVLQNLENGLGSFTLQSVEQVSGSISGELTRKALLALAIASVLQVAYLTYRFEFRFALIAVGTILLDALVVLGLFSLLQWEVNASFVAAILTVIGYSINDKVVVFDRLRENMRQRQRGEPLADIVNRSIHGTLRRCIYTVLTTVVAVAAIAIFGGVTTRTFAIGLMVGITFGAVSSIFIAGPVWHMWQEASGRKAAPQSA